MSRHILFAVPVLALAWPAGSIAMQEIAPGAAYPLSVGALLDEIDRLRATADGLRQELAQARLDANAARRELDEIRQFIADHDEYGADFDRYRAVREAAERKARRESTEAARRDAAARQARQSQEQHAIQERRAREDRERRRVQQYRDAGFTPVGMDVFLGHSAFNYRADDGFLARYDWTGLTGGYLRVWPESRIDFSSMTISGSILNAGDGPRDIAVAVTFFNEAGAQVGGEIIQVEDARPGVPYPFTATVAMALDRPFWTASTYVLYADPAE
jgi:multidrug efflux pump subunit AcrA (membrane-fusion protein)